MRFIPIIFLIGACNSIGQSPDPEQRKEQEFKNLINKVTVTQNQNFEVQRKADQKTNEIITKAAQTITTLKEENKQLKQELHEVTTKLDSLTDLGNGVKFNLRPISCSEEDR